MKDNGIQQRDIQTTQLNIDPVMARQDPDDTYLPKIVGYRVRNGLSAKLRDIRGAGAVIDAAVQAGGDATRIAVDHDRGVPQLRIRGVHSCSTRRVQSCRQVTVGYEVPRSRHKDLLHDLKEDVSHD